MSIASSFLAVHSVCMLAFQSSYFAGLFYLCNCYFISHFKSKENKRIPLTDDEKKAFIVSTWQRRYKRGAGWRIKKKNLHVGKWEGVERGCHLQGNDWNLNLKRRLLRVLSDSICDFCLH